MEGKTWTVFLSSLLIFVVTRLRKLLWGKQAVGYFPGLTIPFQPIGFPGGAFKTTWWNPGLEFMWKWRHTFYHEQGSETVSLVPFIIGAPAIISSDIDVAKQFMAGLGKSDYGKMLGEQSGPIAHWGMSLLITEGDIWKRHRRIVGPAFSNKLYELVWSESLRIYAEMLIAEGLEDKKVVELQAIQKLTFKFTFLIIGRCGFDFPFSWTEPIPATGGKMSFTQATRIFMNNLQILHMPGWVRSIPLPPINALNVALSEIEAFMERKIHEKEEEVRNNRGQHHKNDIFTILVQANDAEADPKLKLDYSELRSNVFLMLIAGHETTAHTLAATVACLAKHPEHQQEVFEQIQSVIGNNGEPAFGDYSKLDKVQASLYEALRLFPTAYMGLREAYHDTVLHVPDPNGEERTTAIHIAKGTQMIIDYVGINRNPRYFESPEEFKPSRWYGISNESEAFYSFGMGPRACIGRKFAMSEAVCLLTMLLKDWRIEPLLQVGETVDSWFDKICRNSRSLVTLAIGEVPIRLVRRV